MKTLIPVIALTLSFNAFATTHNELVCEDFIFDNADTSVEMAEINAAQNAEYKALAIRVLMNPNNRATAFKLAATLGITLNQYDIDASAQAVVDAIPSLGYYYTTDAAELALIEELTSPVFDIVMKYQTESQSITAAANAKARDKAVELGICEGDIALEDDFS
ncbi:MAG TPA: hypothetical protein EYQ12_01625 [Oceanospirillaceae bacterium]|nr:hypothetical protein [Oceanospirillaceae bacterium]